MKRIAVVAGLVVGMTFAGEAVANIVELTFSEKFAESQIVIVGQVIRNLPADPNLSEAVSVVTVTHRLKGRPSKTIRIYRAIDNIAEYNLDCCRVGSTYIMFLERKGSYPYMAVNGRYGVVEVGR